MLRLPFSRMEIVPASALAGEGFIVREPGSGTRAPLDGAYLCCARHFPICVTRRACSGGR